MKKIILSTAILFCSLGAWADDAITTATYGNATGNTTRTMTVALTHTNDYCAFQADLTLPEGTTVKAVTAKTPLINNDKVTISGTEYSTAFNVPFNQDGTSCRILGYNLGNTVIGGTSGDILLTITLTTADGITYNANTVAVSNVIFIKKTTDSSTQEVTLSSATLADVSATTSKLWGDVVVDKVIDGKDVQATADIVAKNSISNDIDSFAADCDQNDTVDGIDLQKTADTVAGK